MPRHCSLIFATLAKHKAGNPYNLHSKSNYIDRDRIPPTLPRNVHPSGTVRKNPPLSGPPILNFPWAKRNEEVPERNDIGAHSPNHFCRTGEPRLTWLWRVTQRRNWRNSKYYQRQAAKFCRSVCPVPHILRHLGTPPKGRVPDRRQTP